MKTETGHPPIRSRDMDPRFDIRIAMWKRVGGGSFPSPAQIEAMRERMKRECPGFIGEKH